MRALRRLWKGQPRLTDWENAPDPRSGPWVIEEWVPWSESGKTYVEAPVPDEGDWNVMHFAITNKRLEQAMDIARALQSVRAGGSTYRLRNIETGDIIMADVL